MLRVGQQEDVRVLRIVSHHSHQTDHTHDLAGRGLELVRSKVKT